MMTAPAILVGNRTGGQGKTLVSQLIHYGYSISDTPIRAISADTASKGEASKLGRILKDVEELGTGADLAEVKENHHAAVQHWDRLGRHLLTGGCVIDLGANILPLVFQWAGERKAKSLFKGKDVRLVIPVTAQAQSIHDGVAMLKASIKTDEYLPISRRYVVLNEFQGGFNQFADDVSYKELIRARPETPVKIIRLSKAVVEVWAQIEAKFLAFAEIAKLDGEAFAETFDVNVFAAAGAESDFKEWLEASIGEFSGAGLVPSVQATPAETESEEGSGVSASKKNNSSKAA